MGKRLNSIKNQLLKSHVTLALMFITIFLVEIGLSYYIFRYKEVANNIDDVGYRIGKLIDQELIFLHQVENSKQFFEEGYMPVLGEYFKEKNRLVKDLDSLLDNPMTHDQEVLIKLDSMMLFLVDHENEFTILRWKLRERGYFDYGLIGKIRNCAHSLEENHYIEMEAILTLRRYEKDYIRRNESRYHEGFISYADSLLNDIAVDEGMDYPGYVALEEYKRLFNKLILLDREIGDFYSSGLKKEFLESSQSMGLEIEKLREFTREKISTIQYRIWITTTGLILLLVVYSVIYALTLAGKRSKPLKDLSKQLKNISEDKLHTEQGIDINPESSEMEHVEGAINLLLRKISEQFGDIESKAKSIKKNNKELKKLNKELDHFVYRISHDLRAPLTSVLGLVNIARIEKDPDELAKIFDMQEQSIARLDKFIHEVLDYSKNSRVENEPEEIHLKEFVYDLAENLSFMPKADQVELITNIGEDQTIYTDRFRLSLILNNLLSNAIHYSDSTKSNSSIVVSLREMDEEYVVDVWDNGIGISEEHLNKIFNMFYRANYDSKGSGLGLYITKEAIDKMGATIEVASEEKKYSLFTLCFPKTSTANANFASDKKKSLKVA